MKNFTLLTSILFVNTSLNAQWIQLNSNVSMQLNDVYFINGDKGFVTGGDPYFDIDGILLETSDGGLTWNQSFPSGSKALTGVSFTSDSIGFLCGIDFILRTSDQGNSWDTVFSSANHGCKQIEFADNNIGYVSYYSSALQAEKLLKTTDGGNSWFELNTEFGFIMDFFFLSADSGALVGYDYASGDFYLWLTGNGGNSWVEKLNGTSYSGWTSVTAIDNQTLIAAYDDDFVSISHNGGISWNEYNKPDGSSSDIVFTSPDYGWMIIGYPNDYPILKTSNGGQLWINDSSITSSIELLQFHFPVSYIGYAVGYNGAIIKYSGSIPVNVDEVKNGMQMEFFPNPATDKLNIRFLTGDPEITSVSIFITDVSGRIVLHDEHSITNNYFNYSLPLDNNIPNGYYLLKMKTADHTWQQPFLLQR